MALVTWLVSNIEGFTQSRVYQINWKQVIDEEEYEEGYCIYIRNDFGGYKWFTREEIANYTDY